MKVLRLIRLSNNMIVSQFSKRYFSGTPQVEKFNQKINFQNDLPFKDPTETVQPEFVDINMPQGEKTIIQHDSQQELSTSGVLRDEMSVEDKLKWAKHRLAEETENENELFSVKIKKNAGNFAGLFFSLVAIGSAIDLYINF
jgi:hypothetical protein